MASGLPMVEDRAAMAPPVPIEKAQKAVAVAHVIMAGLMTRPYLQTILGRALGREIGPTAVETYLDWLQAAAVVLKLDAESLEAISRVRADGVERG